MDLRDDGVESHSGETPTPVMPPEALFARRGRARTTPRGIELHDAITEIEAVPRAALLDTSSSVTTVEVDPAPTVPVGPRASTAAPRTVTRARGTSAPPRAASTPVPSAPPRAASTPAPSLGGIALHKDEVVRARQLGAIGAILAVPGPALAPMIGMSRASTHLLWSSTAVFLLVTALFALGRARRWSVGGTLAAWAAGVVATLGIVLVWGLQSGALALPVLGLYVVALGHRRWVARWVLVTFSLGHVGLVALVASGRLPDPGLVSSGALSWQAQLAIEALLVAALAATYVHARGARRASVRSLDELEAAVRSLGDRDAQLREFQQELARSMRLGADGRWSDEVLGGYRLGGILGRGAVGEVYEATHVDTGAPAAIKLLHADPSGAPWMLARFEREARAAASLRSRHVVRVLAISEDGAPVPYLVMERLRGEDLAGYLRAQGRLPLDEVVEMVEQVADGLEAARVAGIVHRDLKPQNVFRATDPRGRTVWKILDFGVSKLADGGGTLTQGLLVGTPHYMSPEQAAGKPTDHRSDVYALAALAYRCLTGRPPFAGVEMPALLFHVVREAPPRARTLVALPSAVDDVIARGMAKRPDDRPATALELAAALREAARDGRRGRPG